MISINIELSYNRALSEEGYAWLLVRRGTDILLNRVPRDSIEEPKTVVVFDSSCLEKESYYGVHATIRQKYGGHNTQKPWLF